MFVVTLYSGSNGASGVRGRKHTSCGLGLPQRQLLEHKVDEKLRHPATIDGRVMCPLVLNVEIQVTGMIQSDDLIQVPRSDTRPSAPFHQSTHSSPHAVDRRCNVPAATSGILLLREDVHRLRSTPIFSGYMPQLGYSAAAVPFVSCQGSEALALVE